MKKRNKVSSALILLGASALTPFLQGASMVAADESENKSFNKANTGAAKANSSGFFTFFKDLFFKIFFSSDAKSPAKPEKKSVISISSPENFVSSIYDEDIEKAVKETLKREIKKEKEKNKKGIEVSDEEVNKKFNKMPEEERIKRRVKEVIQKNYYTLVAIYKVFSSEKEKMAKECQKGLEKNIKELESKLPTLRAQMEDLKNKVPNFKEIPNKISKKEKLSEDEKSLNEKSKEAFEAENNLRKQKEELESIKNKSYRTSVSQTRYEDVLYKAFDISRRKGNNKAILNGGDYFKEIVGFSESYFRENFSKFKDCFEEDEEGNVIIRNLLNGRKFCAGKFEQISLGKAKEQVSNKNKSEQKGSISIIGINKGLKEASVDLVNKVDVSYLQALEKNRDSLFVIASNFNCVETLSASDDVEEKFIVNYLYDPTQGPAGALPGAAGTILRHYGVNKEKFPKDVSKWRQKSDGEQQVNLLEGLGIKTKNGYILDNIDNILKITERLEKGDENLKNKFKIGYHGNVQVTANKVDFSNGAVSFTYNENQKINQAYVAAVSLNDHDIRAILNKSLAEKRKNYFKGLSKEEKEECLATNFEFCKKVLTDFAKQITKLNYESIFKSAVAKGVKKVYLPLLGCGAFDNDYHWVIDAINENKKFIEENGLEVVLNVVGDGASEKNPNLYKDIAKLTLGSDNKSNGKFKIYDEINGKVEDIGEEILEKIKQGSQNAGIAVAGANGGANIDNKGFFSKILEFFTF